jgi:hypothetical protein
LFCEAEIDLLTALAGGEFAIEHLDDRTLKVQITAGEIIKPGKWRLHHCLPIAEQVVALALEPRVILFLDDKDDISRLDARRLIALSRDPAAVWRL